YIPSTAAISSVRVELQDYRAGGDFSLEYTDKDVINAVTAFHKNINNRLKADIDAGDAINQSLTDQRMVGLRYNNSTDLGGLYMPTYEPYSTIREDVKVYDDDYDSYFNGGYYEYAGEYVGEYAETDSHDNTEKIEFPAGKVGDYVTTYNVSITYYTVTGSSVHRRLHVNIDELIELADIVHDTSLYAEALESSFWNRLYGTYSEYNMDTHESAIPNAIALEMNADTYHSSASHYGTRISGAEEKLKQLTAVYRQDMERMTIEDFHTADIYGYLERVPVYETCTETIALLEEWGVRPFNVPEKYGLNDMENINYDELQEFSIGVRIYAPGTWAAASLQYPCTLADTKAFVKQDAEGTPAYEDVYNFTKTKAMRIRFPKLYELLDVAQTRYVTDEECYLVIVAGEKYVVPPEHSDLAEALIAKGSFSALTEAMADID
ncbi:MAG: hypothetical protein K2I93_06030, partial [Oscillospiraceae bacterium]|nr:hypothetical protein [Oscillospiraceae bacterium]